MSVAALFSRRSSARPIAMVRIVVGLAALIDVLPSYRSLSLWVLPETVRARDLAFVPELPTAGVPVYLAILALSALCFTVGAGTAFSGALLSATIWYKLLVDQGLFSNHEYLLALLTALLTVGDAGAAVSVDAWLGRRRPTVPYWPIWLIKVQISLMYAFTALAKAMSPGFISGTVLRHELYVPFRLRPLWAMEWLSDAVVVSEMFLAVALWVRPCRDHAILLGTAFHALTVALLGDYPLGLLVFSLISVAPYILFLELEPGSRWVIWDDSCALCDRWVRILRTLDWVGVHNFVRSREAQTSPRLGLSCPAAADQAIQVIHGSARSGGIDAVRRIASALPLTFVVAPALGLPGIRWVGDAAYRRLARQRGCRHCALSR